MMTQRDRGVIAPEPRALELVRKFAAVALRRCFGEDLPPLCLAGAFFRGALQSARLLRFLFEAPELLGEFGFERRDDGLQLSVTR